MNATQIQQVDTQGSIGFTGTYQPIGTPDPKPPKNSVIQPISDMARPGNTLPQTNDTGNSWLSWIGLILISIVFLFWKQNKKIKN